MDPLSAYVPGILLAYTAVMLALMSPGPNILAVIGTSMGVGRRQGIALALGVACGTFLWVLLTVIGFTAVIASYAAVMVVLKILGGFYLLWLGYKSLRSAAAAKDVRTSAVRLSGPWTSYFRRGLTVQMTNPKAALAMIAIVSLGIHTGAPVWVGAAIVVGTSLLSLLGHLLYAVTFSTAPVVAVYIKARRTIEAALGALFCAMGIRLLIGRD
ncbi:MAG TPA: LysE family translocator [Burkholderiaceae bacterium]|jgi:threonine/homoserine/homoserine lactone efflux protein